MSVARKTNELIIILGLGVLLIAGKPVAACTCISSGPACQAAWKADAVFSALVIRISPAERPTGPVDPSRPFPQRHVILRVIETFRGQVTGDIDVQTGFSDADCGVKFDEGASYLVYANQNKTIGALQTSICTRTAELSKAQLDVAYLRTITGPEPKVGRISGRVGLAEPSPPDGDRFIDYTGGRVVAHSGDRAYEAVTGADGTYEVSVPPGSYQIEFIPPAGLYGPPPRKTEIPNGRACAEVGATFRWDGRVAGRLFDARGPVPNFALELMPEEALSLSYFSSSFRTRTDQNGAYEFTKIPPGVYHVGFDTTKEPRQPANRTLFPTNEVAPAKIEVPKGLSVAGPDERLPASVEVIRVLGVVQKADGTPAANVSVYVKADSTSFSSIGPSFNTDLSGRFVVSLIAGRRYRLSAELRDGNRYARAETAGFTVSSDLPPLTLVVR